MLKKLLFLIYMLFLLTAPVIVNARTTPEDIVNAQKDAYNTKIQSYTPEHKKGLEKLSQQIVEVNKNRTHQLEVVVFRQGLILDEYQRRNGDKTTPAIENARYWVTFAHEAVAFQAGKVYVFSLTNEKNIRQDGLNTVLKFQSELNYARSTVIKSQNLIEKVVPES